jgi:hypothetical protein
MDGRVIVAINDTAVKKWRRDDRRGGHVRCCLGRRY